MKKTHVEPTTPEHDIYYVVIGCSPLEMIQREPHFQMLYSIRIGEHFIERLREMVYYPMLQSERYHSWSLHQYVIDAEPLQHPMGDNVDRRESVTWDTDSIMQTLQRILLDLEKKKGA